MSPQLTLDKLRILWEIGELAPILRNGQRRIREQWLASLKFSQKFYIECTRRFGKSFFLLTLLSEACIKKPGMRAGYYAPVKEGLRDYIVPIIDRVFASCPEELRPVLDSHFTLTFPNGSTIIFRGSNNQQHRLRRGVDLEIAAIDEGRDVDDLDDLIDSVIMPALFSTGGPLLLASTPADNEDHPLRQFMLALERIRAYVHFTIWDAKRFDPEEFPLDRIEKWREETVQSPGGLVAWQREYEAKWVKDPTKIAVMEWEDIYIAPATRDEFFPYYHKYASLDSGVRDKTAGIFGYYDFQRGKLFVESEFVLEGAEVRTDRIAELIKLNEKDLGYQLYHDQKDPRYTKMAPHEHMHFRVADNDNLILINDLNTTHGFTDFVPTQKDELAAMLNKVRIWVKDGKIIVAPRCTELIGCLRHAIWDRNRKELDRSRTYGHFDALMALVYLVRNVDTITNPIPPFMGKTHYTHAIPPQEHSPRNSAEKFARIFQHRTELEEIRENFIKTGGRNGLT